MRKLVLLVCILWVLTAVAPAVLLRGRKAETPHIPAPKHEEENTAEETPSVPLQPCLDEGVTVEVMVAGEENSFSLDHYLIGVLAAEMPASFPEAALRAQAIAARSFILFRMSNPPRDGVHDGVPLCDDPSHCKAYRNTADEETAKMLFGRDWETALSKLRAAVADTDGIVLTYEGEAALAAFHAISGGRTESAEDVWGEVVPYLIEVESPGEESAVKYQETVTFDSGALRETLEATWRGTVLPEDPEEWLTNIERTHAGMIKSALLGGIPVNGMELRQLLNLNSADFTLTSRGDTVEITTTGYGHGVGMSQYGARAMALSGSDWREILLHYYPGCTLSRLEGEKPLATGVEK